MSTDLRSGGVVLQPSNALDAAHDRRCLNAWFAELELAALICFDDHADVNAHLLHVALKPDLIKAWMPDFDTSQLIAHCALDPLHRTRDLDREIVIAMLGGPLPFVFPSFDEFQASVHIRRFIVQASRKTALSFSTEAAERPSDCWTYLEGKGFVLRPGCSLIDALIKATQPEVSGTMYSFSCYRATEYVILLGIAMELQSRNPSLLAQLERQWRVKPIMSAAFHERFLREFGSTDNPVPMRYCVPGDRLWFRNPDVASADLAGYEGSWVIYLGGGHYSDFWRAQRVYTLESKCLEIFHWRDGLVAGPQGDWQMDEDKVEAQVRASASNAQALEKIHAQMMRYRALRDQAGSEGGCIDSTREFARLVAPATADIVFASEPLACSEPQSVAA